MNNDEYLRLMKQAIDESVKENEKVQQYLVWLHEKTASLGSPYQESALRAFYCDVVEGITSDHYSETSEEASISVNRRISRMLDSKLDKDIDEARTVGSELCKSEYDGITYNPRKLSKFELRRLIYQAKTLPAVNIAFDKDVVIACKQPYLSHHYKYRAYPINGYLGRSTAVLVRSSDQDLRRQIIYIMNVFPNAEEWGEYLYERRLEEWRERLSSCLYTYRNLKLDWQFNDEQKKLLNNYYAANKLLVDCLAGSNTSPEVQKEIQDTLLLPIVEIERRKSGIGKKLLLDCPQESNTYSEVKDIQETLLPKAEIEKYRSNEVQQQVQKMPPLLTERLPTDEIAQHKQENKQIGAKFLVKTNFYTTTLFYSSLLIALMLCIVFITVFRHYIWIL